MVHLVPSLAVNYMLFTPVMIHQILGSSSGTSGTIPSSKLHVVHARDGFTKFWEMLKEEYHPILTQTPCSFNFATNLPLTSLPQRTAYTLRKRHRILKAFYVNTTCHAVGMKMCLLHSVGVASNLGPLSLSSSKTKIGGGGGGGGESRCMLVLPHGH